jgi:hypothetical protein
MRAKAEYWIKKNKLTINERDDSYPMHIKSIDSFLKDDYENSYKLAKKANRKHFSTDTLKLK